MILLKRRWIALSWIYVLRDFCVFEGWWLMTLLPCPFQKWNRSAWGSDGIALFLFLNFRLIIKKKTSSLHGSSMSEICYLLQAYMFYLFAFFSAIKSVSQAETLEKNAFYENRGLLLVIICFFCGKCMVSELTIWPLGRSDWVHGFRPHWMENGDVHRKKGSRS